MSVHQHSVGMVREGNRTVFQDYDSAGDVLDHLDQDPKPDAGRQSHNNEARETWDLNLGWDGAMAAYTGGWSEGAQKAYELAERLVPKPLARRTVFNRDVVGAFPNVGAYLAGAPNAMYRVSKTMAKNRPYIHLYVPLSYSAFVNAESAFDRGCAIVALCDALETVGCRVRITLMINLRVSETTRFTGRFNVKGYGDRLDVDQLIFTAAHPAMFRRIIFGLYERSAHKAVVASTRRGYGRPCNPIPEVDTEPDGRAVLVVLPRLEHELDSPEAYLEQMVQSLPENIQTEITPK